MKTAALRKHKHFDLAEHDGAKSIITGAAMDYPAGHEVPYHRHERCHLLYAMEGVMVVEADSGRWLVPPTTAVWLRPNVEHRLLMRTPVRVRCVFFDQKAARKLPATDRVIHVATLLRELISEVADLSVDVCETRRGKLLSALLLEELSTRQQLPFHLPWPADATIGRVCNALSTDPCHPFSIEEWASSLAMSAKTFQRHFRSSTGLSFGRWRQQARLLFGLDSLLRGTPILQAALQSGYESHSAFTLAFKKSFGVPPSKFVPTIDQARNAASQSSS